MKSLYDISWKVSEDVYRRDSALSYSTLAKHEREGSNNLNTLFDKVETPSLIFGSAVDSIITGGEEEFNNRFIVAEFPSVPDSIVKIIKVLFSQYKDTYNTILSIPDKDIIRETEVLGYQLNWKPETRAKVIKEKGVDYYNLLYIAGDKTILTTQTYQDVYNAVKALKESEATKVYFATDNPFDDIERFYQLKFKASLVGINYRCMMDLALVDHKKKVIIPCDLKTSSHYEWDFYKSFNEWRYDIQARLYWRILRYNMDKDDYFKDFTLTDYHFIVVNKKSLTPLVWEFPYTTTQGDITIGKNNQITWRDPYKIGNELNYYLTIAPPVPIGISESTTNDIRLWCNKL